MPEAVLMILADFRESFGKELGELSEVENQPSAWQDFFHRVKGSGGTLGLIGLQEKSAQFERLAKEDRCPTREELQEFELLLAASCEAAQSVLESL